LVRYSTRKSNTFFDNNKFFLNESVFLGEPLCELCSLASGYPLHHLRASRSVVPLLSLSQRPRFARAGIAASRLWYQVCEYQVLAT
jgi:hypothetical protein